MVDVSSEAFRRWFGKSVIAINGNPLIVYHGGADIPRQRYPVFRPGQGKWGYGIYFAPERFQAERYAELFPSHVVGEYFLRVERPLVVDERIAYHEDSPRLVEDARTSGKHDGIIVVSDSFGGAAVNGFRFDRNVVEIVVFTPRQVKSVENVGTFDSEQSSVLKGLRRSK